ncbi:hypothetical protein IAT40_006196 [Kwoniella sp. CBS 6097]
MSSSSSSSRHPNNLSPSYQVLYQKQQEYAGLQALKEASGDLLQRVEKLAEMSNIMADGGEAVGGVLRNWPHVFSILNLFDKPAERPTTPDQDDEPEEPLPVLVRLPYGGESSTATSTSTSTSTV